MSVLTSYWLQSLAEVVVQIPEEEAERVIHNTGRVDAAGHFEAANQNHALNDEHEDHEGIGRLVEHRTLPHR